MLNLEEPKMILDKCDMHCIYYFDNQTMGNVKIRCRLEKIDKKGGYTQLRQAVFRVHAKTYKRCRLTKIEVPYLYLIQLIIMEGNNAVKR